MPEDRRRAERYIACFPAEVDPGRQWASTALIRDLSVTGALLITRDGYVVGEPVILQLHVSDDLGPRHAAARVLRVERDAECDAYFPHAVAVRFDEPLEDIRAEIAELAERQQSRGSAG